jgi:two-component system OmpR family response regulator
MSAQRDLFCRLCRHDKCKLFWYGIVHERRLPIGLCAAPSGFDSRVGMSERGFRRGYLMEVVPRLRVLCVDDNRDATDSAGELLRLVGFDARVCYDGPTALEVAEEFRPDVCLLDLNMPGMDGDELAARIREQAGDRAVVFVAATAQDDDESRQRTADAGFKLHLVKPVDPHALLDVMDTLRRVLETVGRPGDASPSPSPPPTRESPADRHEF